MARCGARGAARLTAEAGRWQPLLWERLTAIFIPTCILQRELSAAEAALTDLHRWLHSYADDARANAGRARGWRGPEGASAKPAGTGKKKRNKMDQKYKRPCSAALEN